MTQRKGRAINFIRRNIYYFIFLICLSIVTLITVALVVVANDNSPIVDGGNDSVIDNPSDNPTGNPTDAPSDTPTDNPSDTPSDTPTDNPSDTPTVTVIVFDMPVNGTIIKEYVSAGVVYNQTLGVYTGHKAIDFSAEEGFLRIDFILCASGENYLKPESVLEILKERLPSLDFSQREILRREVFRSDMTRFE